jgi:hypothetical protein
MVRRVRMCVCAGTTDEPGVDMRKPYGTITINNKTIRNHW